MMPLEHEGRVAKLVFAAIVEIIVIRLREI